jgi:hypothetical protein
MRKFLKNRINPDSLPKILFILSLCLLSFAYGYISLAGGLFPHALISESIKTIDEWINEPDLPPYLYQTEYLTKVPVYDPAAANNGLSFVAAAIEDRKLSARVIDMNGEIVHQWVIDWFDLWSDATHISETDAAYPQMRPGTMIHGAVLLENGDLIFNFNHLGMIRLDPCGNVVWRLGYRTHHKIYLDENDILWVPGQINHDLPLPNLPNHEAPFIEPTVIKVSLDGELLKEISLIDVFKENDLEGLLNLSSLAQRDVSVTGDTLHLNDVETFPSYLEEGVFTTGDIMVSLRNINTVLVFREEDLQVTQIHIGTWVRQHDPDFIDGNTISVFDNYNVAPEEYGQQSRILIKSVSTGEYSVYYTGSEGQPFYTDIVGNHQWLPNGNMLITESIKGRAFEIDPEGIIVWEYINILEDGIAGIIDEVYRLPDFFTKEQFNRFVDSCNLGSSD